MAKKINEDRPLDALFPELAGQAPLKGVLPSKELEPLHPGVLEVELEGGWQWSMALWRDEPGVRGRIERMVGDVWLRGLSQAGREKRRLGFDLMCFEPLKEGTAQWLTHAGFCPVPFDSAPEREVFSARLKSWQGVAGEAVVPQTVWQLGAESPPTGMAPLLQKIDDALIAQFGDEPWGERPGHLSHALIQELSSVMLQIPEAPTWEALHALDMALVSRATGCIRHMSPRVFQAVCDFVGVVWSAQRGWEVQWSQPQRAPDGAWLPPMFQIPGSRVVPVGQAVYATCVAPLPQGKEPVWLRQWAEEI